MKTTKEKAEVMLAFDRGEQIQFYDTICKRWIDVINEPNWCWSLQDYRIKPKPKFMPFKTPEEFIEAQGKHGSYIKSIEDGILFNSYVNYMGYVLLEADINKIGYSHINLLYRRYVFTDGAPCGKEVNV